MKYWIINRVLDFKEREILMITLEAAGFEIYSTTRTGISKEEYPYIGTSLVTPIFIAAFSRITNTGHNYILTYEQIMDKLHKIIKNEGD